MNRIILVGNGFDLAHGLKTKYEDFINWYFEQLKKELSDCFSPTFKTPLCKLVIDTKYNEYEHWGNFMYIHQYRIRDLKNLKLLEYIQGCSHIFVHKFDLLKRLIMSINSKGWVDIESDYYELLKDCLEANNPAVIDLQNQLGYIQKKLTEYLLCVQQSSDVQINTRIGEIINEPIFARDISQYAKKYIIKSDDDDRMYPLNESLILDFNYTNTTSKYHRDVIHIHGSLADPKTMIFGYGDELDENYKKLSNLNDNHYLKNIKSIRYLESGNYRDLLRFINAAPYQIYIMGHSCGNSDRTLLNTLFEHENCVSIKPFYYQKDEENDNYSEITQNISRNFTNMQSFRDKVVNKTLCEPMPQIQI